MLRMPAQRFWRETVSLLDVSFIVGARAHFPNSDWYEPTRAVGKKFLADFSSYITRFYVSFSMKAKVVVMGGTSDSS